MFVQKIREVTGKNSKVVFVSGNFNILHPGHFRLFKFAKDNGDFLVVGVNGEDPNSTNLLSADLRLEGVQASSYVDYAFLLDSSVVDCIEKLKPQVIVKGSEFEEVYNLEQNIVDSYGGKLIFSSGEVKFSSLDLIWKEFTELEFSAIKKPKDFLARNDFSLKDLADIVKKFDDLKVVVIGDTIVDEYISCEPLGMSREDPAIAVSPIESNMFLGGAAIVSAHAKGLGADVSFLTVLGNDALLEFVEEKLEGYCVTSYIYKDESRPTTLKQRYRAQGKTLLRVNHLKQHHIHKDYQESILKDLEELIKKGVDLVVFSDFNYGCLPQPLVEKITYMCNRYSVIMSADSQSSSQVGDISRFKETKLLTPTEHEARLALNDSESGLVILAEKLRAKTKAENIFITLASEGMLIDAPISTENRNRTDRLPAMNMAPKDVSGAGDSMMACAALALAAGGNIMESAYISSLAAACQVGRVGNVPLLQEELFQELQAPS